MKTQDKNKILINEKQTTLESFAKELIEKSELPIFFTVLSVFDLAWCVCEYFFSQPCSEHFFSVAI
jgi:hypothetical protein